MKITIDTKEDSKEEIIKAIKLMQSLVDETVFSNIASNSELPSTGDNIFGGMFETPAEPDPYSALTQEEPKSEDEESEEKEPFSIRNFEVY